MYWTVKRRRLRLPLSVVLLLSERVRSGFRKKTLTYDYRWFVQKFSGHVKLLVQSFRRKRLLSKRPSTLLVYPVWVLSGLPLPTSVPPLVYTPVFPSLRRYTLILFKVHHTSRPPDPPRISTEGP